MTGCVCSQLFFLMQKDTLVDVILYIYKGCCEGLVR